MIDGFGNAAKLAGLFAVSDYSNARLHFHAREFGTVSMRSGSMGWVLARREAVSSAGLSVGLAEVVCSRMNGVCWVSDSYLGVFRHRGGLPDIVLALSEVNLLVRRTKEDGEGSCPCA